MNAKNSVVTRGPWNVGGCYGSGIDGYEFHPFRLIEGHNFKDGKFRFLYGQLTGRYSMEEYDNGTVRKLSILYGYSKYYSRNTCGFVQSRAARKRGYVTTDRMYTDRQREYRGFRTISVPFLPLGGKFVVMSADGTTFARFKGEYIRDGVDWVASIADATPFDYKGEALFYCNALHYAGTTARVARLVS